jgi:hypothetical protein
MEKNKTGQYFKYAIGEIVLVVIGILIALQINNWNNNRAERSLENDILNEILVNLETDLQNIEIKKEQNIRYIKSNTLVSEHLKNKTPLTDSLRFHYARLYGFGNFEPIKVGYENLKSRGLNIVKSQSLRKEISELYEYKYYFMVEDIREAIVNIQKQHSDEILEKLIGEPWNSKEPIDLIALQNDMKFQNVLTSIIFTRSWTNYNLEKGKQEIIKVKKALEINLSKN